jgi:hypothetical protein
MSPRRGLVPLLAAALIAMIAPSIASAAIGNVSGPPYGESR